MSLFQLDNVRFDVADRSLITDLSLQIGTGVTALIGRNGSGKSTLLKMLAAQAAPTGGSVRYQGRAVQSWSRKALARDLAFLPQVTPATEGMRVEELVALGRYPWRGALGRMGPADHGAIDEAIALCGLNSLRRRIVDTLSGGERQRAWIAMMLAQGAQTLLLDEPISALDVAHQVEVLGLVHRMSRERSLSAIVVLHDVNMAARFCDHVVALGEGRILLDAPVADLLDPATLHRIYGLPMQVIPASPFPVVHPL